MSKIHLLIITRGFPMNEEELSFLLPELRALDKDFVITLIPKYTTRSNRVLCEDYPYVECDCRLSVCQKIRYGLCALKDKRLYQEWKLLRKEAEFSISTEKQILTDILFSKQLDEILNRVVTNISEEDKIVIYSYWFDYSLLSATKLKETRNLKIITRMHGFDLYHERSTTGYQCFKNLLFKQIDRLVFISEYGRKYYENRYLTDDTKDKLQTHFLGTKAGKMIPLCEEPKIRIITCSYIVPLKRLDILIDALALENNLEIEWIHIGDGENRINIVKRAEDKLKSKENISYQFLGHMEIDDIYHYYEKNYFDCFILLSDTEGLPVSIMEAMSFGMPVIANDVGGVKEIVNQNNGWLLPTQVTEKEVRQVLQEYSKLSRSDKEKKREAAFTTWNQKFNISQNAKRFGNMIKDMVDK